MKDLDNNLQSSGIEIEDIVKTFYFRTHFSKELIDGLVTETDEILADDEYIDYAPNLAGKIYDGIQVKIKEDSYSKASISILVESIQAISHSFVERYFSKIENDKLVGLPPSFRCEINDMWIVSQEAHDYNPPHEHMMKCNLGLSGVVYLKIPEQIDGESVDGCFYFSWGPDVNFDLLRFRYPDHKTVTPKPGMFLIFPKNTTHEVFPFRGPGERRCIAFNVNVFPSDGEHWVT